MKVLGILLLISSVCSAAAAQMPASTQRGADAPERAADNRDKMICKRFLETGSLVRGTRICKTKLDWERDRDMLKAQAPADSCRLRALGGAC